MAGYALREQAKALRRAGAHRGTHARRQPQLGLAFRTASAARWRFGLRLLAHLRNKRIVRDEIRSGVDELGVLLMGHPKGAYWLGSRLSNTEAQRIAPFNSATVLQVTAGVMAGMVWAIRNPAMGVVEPDEMPYAELIELCKPYLGEVVGVYTDWTPLKDRAGFFPEDIDPEDPWQFKNFRVT